jgi:hypothetical protein
LETIKKYYRIERKEICFLKFIFEAYDGIAMITTLDSDSGVVMFHIAPGCEDDVEMVLQDLQNNIMIEEVLCGGQGPGIRDQGSVNGYLL